MGAKLTAAAFIRILKNTKEWVYKPGSVVDEHLSSDAITYIVMRSTCGLERVALHAPTQKFTSEFPLDLAPSGVYLSHISHLMCGGLLHHLFTLTELVGGYFLWHFPADHSGWALPTTVLFGARTFLSRSCVRPTHSFVKHTLI